MTAAIAFEVIRLAIDNSVYSVRVSRRGGRCVGKMRLE
jgi:hypothetical protein